MKNYIKRSKSLKKNLKNQTEDLKKKEKIGKMTEKKIVSKGKK